MSFQFKFYSICFMGILLLVFKAGATDSKDINSKKDFQFNLSPTASLSWPMSAGLNPLFTPKHESFILFGKNGIPQGELRRFRPAQLATPRGVERYWKESKTLSVRAKSYSGFVTKKSACRSIASGRFECYQEKLGKNGQSVIDVLYWNRDHDLIFLHLSSASEKSNLKLFSEMKVNLK